MERKQMGERIRAFREKAGYSQQSIASFLDVDQSLVSKIEKGDRAISADMLEKLASLFGVELSTMLDENASSRSLAYAFRASDLSVSEMETISAINRIALNSEFMDILLKEKNCDRQD